MSAQDGIGHSDEYRASLTRLPQLAESGTRRAGFWSSCSETRHTCSRSEFSDYLGWNLGWKISALCRQVLWNDGGQGRNRTADASLFRATLCCTFNDLTDSRWPPNYLKSRERHANRGLETWVQSQCTKSLKPYFEVTTD